MPAPLVTHLGVPVQELMGSGVQATASRWIETGAFEPHEDRAPNDDGNALDEVVGLPD